MGGQGKAPQYPISRSNSCCYNIKSAKCLTDIFCNFFRTVLSISIRFLRETCQFKYNFWEIHVDFNTIFEIDMSISIQFLRGTCWFNTIFEKDMFIQYNFWEGHVNFNTIFYMDVEISIHFLRDMSIALWFLRGICQFQYSNLVQKQT